MRVGVARSNASAGRALEEPDLHQVRLVDIHNGVRLFRNRRCDRLDTNRPAVVLLDDRAEHFVVDIIEAEVVDVQADHRLLSDRRRDLPISAHLRVVPHAAKQAVCHARRPPRTSRNLLRAVVFGGHLQDLGVATDDRGDRRLVVEIQPVNGPEAVTQRW